MFSTIVIIVNVEQLSYEILDSFDFNQTKHSDQLNSSFAIIGEDLLGKDFGMIGVGLVNTLFSFATKYSNWIIVIKLVKTIDPNHIKDLLALEFIDDVDVKYLNYLFDWNLLSKEHLYSDAFKEK